MSVQVEPQHLPILSRLMDEALALPPEARDRWLEALPSADRALKPMLGVLLRRHAVAATRDFDGVLPRLPVAEAVASASAAARRIAPGALVGPYVIEEEIGRGGMGTVWRARRSDGVIKRSVALKLPHAGHYGRELFERFASERDILGKLSHPNIARLYDAGFDSAGQPFLALEHVVGVPLTRYCDQHRMDLSQRLRLFQQVLHAVQYAHGHLVIHRDLKPSNVIVGADGRAMLLDFGIAKLVESEPADAQPAPATRGMLTPAYASPEQVDGRQVTTASDVYSLGVLLFELLTGSPAYRRELRAAHSLRPDLDAIIVKATQADPAQRYATADAFSQDVEHYLNGQPVAAYPESGWYRARKFLARNKLPVAAVGLALAVLFATAAVALFEARTVAAERDRALALSSRSEAVAEFLDILITEAAAADRPVTVSDMLARSEGLVKSEYGDSPEHRAAVLDLLGMYYQTNGNDVRAEPLLRAALQAVQTSSDGDLRRKITCDHAGSVASLGKTLEAGLALRTVAADPQASPRQAAECLEYLSFIAQSANDAADALTFAKQALQRLSQSLHPPPTLEGVFLGSIAYAEHLSGRNDVATQVFERALARFERVGRERGPEAITVRNNFAVVQASAGNPKRALELIDRTLELAVQNDPGAPLPPYLLANRARALDEMGRFAAARMTFAQCIGENGKTPTPRPQTNCLLGLAAVEHELGDLSAAKGYVDSAAEIVGDSAVDGSPERVALQTMRGRIALTERRFGEARSNLDAVIAAGKRRSQVGVALLGRAELNLLEGKLAAAEADARNALRLAQSAQGGIQYSRATGLAWLMLGRVLARQSDPGRAHSALQAAVEHLSNTVDDDHPLLESARQLVRE